MPTTSRTTSDTGHFARSTSAAADHLGRPGMFLLAATNINAWAISGPVLDFSGT